MEQLIIPFLVLIIMGLALMFFVLLKKKSPGSESLVMLQGQLSELKQVLDSKLGESAKSMQMQFNQSARIIRDVTEK